MAVNAAGMLFGLVTVVLLVLVCASENDETRSLFEALAIASAVATVLLWCLEPLVERIG